MAEQGLAVASVDYRLSGEARFPAQSDDVTAAISWLREGSQFGLGHLPLTVFGVSAGGLLASLAALDVSLDIRAAALWYAVSDIATMRADQAAVDGPVDAPGESREELLIGGRPSELPEVARAASPLRQVHAGAPPVLLLHGTADILVPTRQSERMRDALQEVGVENDYVAVEGYGHMFPDMPDHELATYVDRTTEFLLAHSR
jgi:acetyl esterase/lipase